MNKKAMSMDVLVILLILALGAIALFAFSGKLSSLFREDADIETCRLSVLAQSQTRKLPLVGSTPKTMIPLDCPRRNIKIFEDKVELNAKKSRKYDFKKLTKDEVNYILAEELRLCWYKMAEGNRDVFENAYLWGFPYNVCLICTEIQFDDKSKGKSFDGFVDYLKSNKIPKLDTSYFDYLVKSQPYPIWGIVPFTQYTPWGYIKTGDIYEEALDTNQKYAIYFLAYKPNWLDQFTRTYTKAYFIGLGKEDKIVSECDELVN